MSRNDRGAAVVEFALVAPLLILLLVGIAEFGRAYYLQTTLSGSAREAVRTMALDNDSVAARATARSAAAPLVLSDGQIGVTPTTCVSTTGAPASATVTISYVTPFMSGLFGTTLTLEGRGVMRCGG